MRVLVLEDELPAREQLIAAVHEWDPDVTIAACLDNVQEASRWLLSEPTPDLILADVRLTDGDSLEIFDRVAPHCPIVFVTAYDRYALDALEAGGIDYLLKPLQPKRVAKALDKVLALRRHFRGASETFRQRIVVRHHKESLAIPVGEIGWFNTEHRLVFAVRRDGRRFVVDKTLGELATELDPARFFRISRSWIVAVDAIAGYRSHGKGRLAVSLQPGDGEEAVVSAEHADAFRRFVDR